MSRLAATAVAASALALLAAAPALAQAASGTIQLNGSVQVVCTVAVTDNNVALNLAGGESARAVGRIVETCNKGNGYTITVASANAGTLTSGAAGATPISYTVGYDGASGGLSTALQVNRDAAQFGRQRDLTVTVPASTQYIAGSYADTVTVSIAAR